MEDHMNMDLFAIITENENEPDSGKKTGITKHCDLCEVSFLQEYLENHNCSKKHLSKLKETNETPPALASGHIYCPSCDKMFSDNSFYEAHKGTKTHKRNVKAHQGQSDVSSISTIFGGAFSERAMKMDVQVPNDQVEEAIFTRKKYKTRPPSEEVAFRQHYINLLTAFLSLRLALDTNVKDFNISTNDKRWQSFGDIVIDVTTNKNKYTVYAIKMKQVSDTEKRIDSLSQAKVFMDKEYESLTSLKNIQEFSDAKFLIFTTNSVSSTFSSSECETTVEVSGKTLNLWKTDRGTVPKSDILLVNPSKRKDTIIDVTSDCENIFSIYPKIENESYSLPFVYLYVSQKVNPSMIDDLLRKKFETAIYSRYFKYIEKWIDGDLGGNYYLKKRDVILKIGELLLNPYVRLPKRIKYNKEGNFVIWNEVIANVDLTVIRKENHIFSKICQPINQIIEQVFGKINGLSKSINITDEVIKALTEPAIRAYLFEEYNTKENKSEISLGTIYNIFWKSGKIPLLLESEKNNESYLIAEVIFFMKQYGVNRKFILKTSQAVVDKRLRIFSCLEDIKDIVKLEKVGFRVSEDFLSLETISSTDPFFLRWITPNIFIEMALGRYRIQTAEHSYDENSDDLKMILDDRAEENLLLSLYGGGGSSFERTNEGRLKGINPLWF